MSKKRYINTRIWSDNYFSNLDPIEKLLFIYLITNPFADICGIYEIPVKQIALDTGIDREEMVPKIIQRLSRDGKIYYIDGWVYVKNFIRHQAVNDKIKIGIQRSLSEVPERIIAKIKQIDIDYDSLYIDFELPKPKPKLKPIGIETSQNEVYTDRDSILAMANEDFGDDHGKRVSSVKIKRAKKEIDPIFKYFCEKGNFFIQSKRGLIQSTVDSAATIESTCGLLREHFSDDIPSILQYIDTVLKTAQKEGWFKKIRSIQILSKNLADYRRKASTTSKSDKYDTPEKLKEAYEKNKKMQEDAEKWREERARIDQEEDNET